MEEDKKFYWLKLKKDFFKRHDIRIIEDMPNGKDYVLFYLKLLCESVDHEGNLRFSEQIPYNESMLSTITNTNIDIVRSAIKVFTELQLMEMLDDKTIYMSEVSKMMGYETEWAKKKREYRERIKSGQCPSNVLTMSDKSKSIEKEKEIDIELDIEKEKNIIKKENEAIGTLEQLMCELEEMKGKILTPKESEQVLKIFNDYGYKTALYEIKKNQDKSSPIAYTFKVLYEPIKPQQQETQCEWLKNFKKQFDEKE